VGSSNYDLVTMNAAPELGREIPKGFWKVLDPRAHAQREERGSKIMQLLSRVDPGNQHAVPWMWGTTGIIYNVDKVKAVMPAAPIGSLDMVLKKEVVAKFAGCGIGLLDSWGDIMPWSHVISASPPVGRAGKSRRGCAKLKEIRPYIRRVSTSGYYQQLAEGDLCVAIGYSGDALISRRMINESHGNIKIEYSFAREMVPFYIDSIVIPADSPNPSGASAFIDFVMRPEVSASVTRFHRFCDGECGGSAAVGTCGAGQYHHLSAPRCAREVRAPKNLLAGGSRAFNGVAGVQVGM